MNIIKLKDKEKDVLGEAKKIIESGGLIIYPTDTVYGIGGDATDPIVVNKIKQIKKIRSDTSFSVMCSDINMIEEYCVVDLAAELVLKKYLPGPYTFILKLHRPIAAASGITLGVRIPELSFCYELCAAVKRPIITTSASLSDKSSPVDFSEIDSYLLKNVNLAIDGGRTKYEGPSIVVDLVNKKIIRGSEKIDLESFISF